MVAAIAILALAYLVTPTREETIIEVPLDRLTPGPAAPTLP